MVCDSTALKELDRPARRSRVELAFESSEFRCDSVSINWSLYSLGWKSAVGSKFM